MKPDTNEVLARLFDIAQNSPCSRRKYGAAVYNYDWRRVVYGSNRPPIRCEGPNWTCAKDCARMRHSVLHNTRVELCHAVHAEWAALLKASWLGVLPYYIYVAGFTPDGTLVNMPKFPCTVCVRLMAEAGVAKVTTWTMRRSVLADITRGIDSAWNEAYSYVLGRG